VEEGCDDEDAVGGPDAEELLGIETVVERLSMGDSMALIIRLSSSLLFLQTYSIFLRALA